MSFEGKQRQAGFTLIELMAVIGIIGLLAGIAVPRLVGTRDRGFEAAIRGDLAALRTAQELYYWDQTPPTYAGELSALHDEYVNESAILAPDGSEYQYDTGGEEPPLNDYKIYYQGHDLYIYATPEGIFDDQN